MKILEEARLRFKQAAEADEHNRSEMVEDLEFKLGGDRQWPESVKKDRKDRPMITVNRMGQFIKQVMGDIRQNSPSIRVRPVDDLSDPETADIYEGIIRHIEHNSNAQAAYNTAAEGAVSCGYGAFRIITEWSDNDIFNQDIKIKRIRNQFTTYSDPNAEELNRSDGMYWFVSSRLSEDEFKAKYPKAKKTDFESYRTGNSYGDWFNDDGVRVCEYWKKCPITKTLGLLQTGQTIEISQQTPEDVLMHVVKTREVDSVEVKQYILSGSEVLEENDWAGKYIPIIPVYGEEENIEGQFYYKGIIRDAKDPQRLYNYWRTTSAETIALQPKVPYKLTADQIKGYEKYWKAANKANLPYILYNPDPMAPGAPQREVPPQPPAAMWQESQIAADDMKAATGIYDAGLGQQSNETSGRAIIARQRESDTSTFIYIDHLSIAIQYAGKILVDLIPKIYDTQRALRLFGEDGSEKLETINQIMPDGQSQFDLSQGKYDVRVDVGPSYSTKRTEAADSMMQFVAAFPQAGQVAGDLIAKSMDWPGAEDIAERLKKTLPPGMVDVDQKDPEAMQAYQQGQAQAQQEQQLVQQERLAELDNKEADTEYKKAQTAEKTADTQQTLNEMNMQMAELAGQLELFMWSQAPPELLSNEPEPPPGGFFTPE